MSTPRTRLVAAAALGLVAPTLALAGTAGSAAAATPTCRGVPATIVGTDRNDRISGTRGRDVIVARGGEDRIRAGAGRDLVCGNEGADRIHGQVGADVLVAGRGIDAQDPPFVLPNDVLVGGAGDDELRVGPRSRDSWRVTVSWKHSPRAIRADLRRDVVTGRGRDRIVGSFFRLRASDHADLLLGSGRADILRGAAGDDEIRGRRGKDRAFGELGADTVRGGPGEDEVLGGSGSDRLGGGPGRDSVEDYGDTADVLRGGAAGDYLIDSWTTAEGQVVDGGKGVDRITTEARAGGTRTSDVTTDLGAGTTTFEATGTTVRTESLERFTLMVGGPRDESLWTVLGTGRSEEISADGYSAVHATMRGGDDVVYAGSGHDYVDGGEGEDTAWLGRWEGTDNTCIDVEHCHG